MVELKLNPLLCFISPYPEANEGLCSEWRPIKIGLSYRGALYEEIMTASKNLGLPISSLELTSPPLCMMFDDLSSFRTPIRPNDHDAGRR